MTTTTATAIPAEAAAGIPTGTPTTTTTAIPAEAATTTTTAIPTQTETADTPTQAETAETCPVSFAQQRLWFLNRLEGPNASYNVQVLIRLDGALDEAALAAALHDLVERHESLRTVLGETDGIPHQRILTTAGSGIALRPLPAEELRAEFERPFDLDTDVPLRAFLVREAADRHLLALVMHHVVCDGWSMTPLLRDLGAAYDARHAGRAPGWEPLPVQYADYALWQRDLLGSEDDPDSRASQQLAHWRETLVGLPDELALPCDRVRPAVPGHGGGVLDFTIPAELHAGLSEIARRTGASLFMVLQAAVAAVLSRTGAGTDIPLGTAVAGRTDEALDDLVGMFVNTLVLRADLSGAPTFLELVERVRVTSLAAYDHQDLPFERLVEALNPHRVRSRHPLFQVMVKLHNGEETEAEVPMAGLTTTLLPVGTDTARFDLAWDFVETAAPERGGTLTAHLSHATDLFDSETAERLRDWLLRLLTTAVEHPEIPVARIPLATDEERNALLACFTDPEPTPYPTVIEAVRAHALTRPDAPAVVDDVDGATDYAGLVARADAASRALAAAGADRGCVVAVLAARGAAVISGILGITGLGAVYLPLDPAAPHERNRNVLADAGVRFLLADAAHEEAARALAADHADPPEVLVVPAAHGTTPETTAGTAAETTDRTPLPVRTGPDDPAYVLFTSGSTGRPKGAVVYHRGLLINCRNQAEATGIGVGTLVAHSAPLTFDISLWQMFAPLVSGGTVRAVAEDWVRDPCALFELAGADRVEVMQVVPSVLQTALDEWDTGVAAAPELALRRIATVGEALPADLCRRWAARYPRIPLVNCYGPTECSDIVARTTITTDTLPTDARTPIGTPAPGARLYVLGDDLEWTPTGIAGELWIGGIVVGAGYLGDPARTATTFVADPWAAEPGARMYRTGDLVRHRRDGRLEYLGRLDHQVKIRGRRVELGEIEHALRSVPGVLGAVVTAAAGPDGNVLVGYHLGGTDPDAIRAELARTLPESMIPRTLIALDAFPLNASGKLDRKALPAPVFGARAGGRPPATRRERFLCSLYEEVLGAPGIGLDDDFFALGGHSLLAIPLIRRINAAFGLDMGVCMVFECPTVDEMNALLDRAFAERDMDPDAWERAAAPTPSHVTGDAR
ncbi:amino acid adenylation domain-containing protein [Streptomyces sp. JJ66]|uniref:non-ribosomal peptide synthetase n=1 Tax=Streptomyces sp. JJ66 TaxID=2803843 RepID=UPI001C5A04AC|nr:non-ribosomal peptide synthetase [Streptomyces sp. JJ66]MBW1603869.1 amino acid adenylation domain-containing protein [Streptomyces sp. JJ66]